MTQSQVINKVARSHNQSEAIKTLLQKGKLQFNVDYCIATMHYNSYVQSWLSFYARLQEAGVNVQYQKGKRGGVWTSCIKLV